MQSKWQCNDDLHHAWLITLWRIWHANQWKMMCSPLKNDSNPFSTNWQEKSLTDLQVRAKAKNYLALSSLCCYFANPEGIDQSSNFFFFNVKILIPFRISFCFPGKSLNVQMFSVFVLNSIMTSNASKWALPVVNILIMLITSCDSIDSILQQHPCLVPRTIALTFCTRLFTSPWPFLREVLDRAFMAYLHSGHTCMGPK